MNVGQMKQFFLDTFILVQPWVFFRAVFSVLCTYRSLQPCVAVYSSVQHCAVRSVQHCAVCSVQQCAVHSVEQCACAVYSTVHCAVHSAVQCAV